jgi:hypothetical protein
VQCLYLPEVTYPEVTYEALREAAFKKRRKSTIYHGRHQRGAEEAQTFSHRRRQNGKETMSGPRCEEPDGATT